MFISINLLLFTKHYLLEQEIIQLDEMEKFKSENEKGQLLSKLKVTEKILGYRRIRIQNRLQNFKKNYVHNLKTDNTRLKKEVKRLNKELNRLTKSSEGEISRLKNNMDTFNSLSMKFDTFSKIINL
jgi:hypothetical protein